MDEPSFDREIIAKNPNLPQCGVSDIANGNGYLRLHNKPWVYRQSSGLAQLSSLTL